MNRGYVITILGSTFQKDIFFLETKPTREDLEAMIKEHGAIQAFVTEGESFALEKDYLDERGNFVEITR